MSLPDIVKIDGLVWQLQRDVISHENQSQHYPNQWYLCEMFSGQLTTPDRFSYHTDCKSRTLEND